jgi:hypothetical protein
VSQSQHTDFSLNDSPDEVLLILLEKLAVHYLEEPVKPVPSTETSKTGIPEFLSLRRVSKRFNGNTLDVLYRLNMLVKGMKPEKSKKMSDVQSRFLDQLANPAYLPTGYPSLKVLDKFSVEAIEGKKLVDAANAMYAASRLKGETMAVEDGELATLLCELSKNDLRNEFKWEQLYSLKYVLNADQLELVFTSIFGEHFQIIDPSHLYAIKFLLYFSNQMTEDRLRQMVELLFDAKLLDEIDPITIQKIVGVVFDQMENTLDVGDHYLQFINQLLIKFHHVIDISQMGTLKPFLLQNIRNRNGRDCDLLISIVGSALTYLPSDKQREFAYEFLQWSCDNTRPDANVGTPGEGYPADHMFWRLLTVMDPIIFQNMLFDLAVTHSGKLVIFIRRMFVHNVNLIDEFMQRIPSIAVECILDRSSSRIARYESFNLLKKMPSIDYLPLVLDPIKRLMTESPYAYNGYILPYARPFFNELLATGKCTPSDLAGFEAYFEPISPIFSRWRKTIFASAKPHQAAEKEEKEEVKEELKGGK